MPPNHPPPGANRHLETAIRSMSGVDIGAGLRLSQLAGWNQTRVDWEAFLSLRPNGCFAAEHDGKVVGTVTTIDYAARLSWIGMLLVDPDARRQGTGTRLLQEAMHSLETCETVKLDATATGRKVYLKLGFQDEYEIARMVCRDHTAAAADTQSRTEPGWSPLQPHELQSVTAYDAPIFGQARANVLRTWYRKRPDYAFVARLEGKLAGYCLGRTGRNFEQIGPITADDLPTAEALLHAALHHVGTRPALVDAPLLDRGLSDTLERLGFTEQRRFMRMFNGPNLCPGVPQKLYAIAGPELG